MGMRVILGAIKWMNAQKTKLSIINIPEVVREAFELTGLLDLFVHDEKLVIIETEKTKTRLTLPLAGALDAETFQVLEDKLEQLKEDGVSLIILDCFKLSSISPEGRQRLDIAGGGGSSLRTTNGCL
jgi:anti-anti-sigma regulatory factor